MCARSLGYCGCSKGVCVFEGVGVCSKGCMCERDTVGALKGVCDTAGALRGVYVCVCS